MFEDTDTLTAFSTVDWALAANDSSFNYFAIRNLDNNGEVFRIDDGARTNALYVDNTGRVGLGTSIPQADLHVVDDGNATIWLQRVGTLPNVFELATLSGGFGIYSRGNDAVLRCSMPLMRPHLSHCFSAPNRQHSMPLVTTTILRSGQTAAVL